MRQQQLLQVQSCVVKVAERMGGYLCGAATTLMVALGDSLGLFRYMAGMPPATSSDIADGTNLHERWVREMLYQLVRPEPYLFTAVLYQAHA